MTRNKQLTRCPSCGLSYEDALISSPSLVEGRIVLSTVKAKEHFAQFTPAAFSLQAIYDNGLAGELRDSVPLSGSSLDCLDSFSRGIMSHPVVSPSNSSENGTSESKVTETNN